MPLSVLKWVKMNSTLALSLATAGSKITMTKTPTYIACTIHAIKACIGVVRLSLSLLIKLSDQTLEFIPLQLQIYTCCIPEDP